MKYNRRHGLNHVVVRFSSANGVGGRSGFGLQSFRPELEMLFSAVVANSTADVPSTAAKDRDQADHGKVGHAWCRRHQQD
ncbi:unnamed protein product [Sphagnum troendelagicum]|uniref:Uncharacterized protein n=1 Tax=Sphagnum jensenii TaxID=128206 RepID=A0ABP0W8J2_9BRYO